jgi:hypothetical protein
MAREPGDFDSWDGALVALDARRLRRAEPAPPLSAGFIVMADPEGNSFCRLSPIRSGIEKRQGGRQT